MLEAPKLDEAALATAVYNAFGLHVNRLDFLPLGADADSAVYRVDAGDKRAYLLKLRRGEFNTATALLPKFLADQGVAHVIPPVATTDARLWVAHDAFTLTLFPFVHGRDGYEVDMSARQWAQLGETLRGMHSLALPHALRDGLPVWRDAAHWRTRMAALLDDAARAAQPDPLAAETAAYLRTQREPIGALIRLAAKHAAHMATRAHDIVLCHADIHAGNVLLTEDGALFVIDWDTIILAPKERDLMFVGGGLMGAWRAPQEEERLFYAGYGAAQVDPSGLAYFRAMRILEDLVLYADELLHSDHGGEDRALALHYLKSNFRPGSTIDLVTQTPA